jgi:hypothetical protein
MNFNSLYNKLEIIEEARASRFETLFQTGYLKKAMIDKGVGVPRPLVFQFIMDFLESKGLVPEGTAFKGSRYAAEAGEFIKKLVDDGIIKDEIADEFKEYTKNNLGEFIGRKFQTTKHRTGEFAKKQQMEGGEERGKVAGELRKIKSAEELAAERQAKKEAEQARAEDISPTSPYEFKDYQVYIETKNEVSLELVKIKKIFTALAKGTPVEVDIDSTPTNISVSMDPESPVAKGVIKFGEEKINSELVNLLAKQFRVDPEDIMVNISPPHIMDIDKDLGVNKTKAQQTGVDTDGYSMGTIAGDDSARRLANPFEDEEEPVTKAAKPKVQFISNKDRFQPKTIWQKIAQQELYYK